MVTRETRGSTHIKTVLARLAIALAIVGVLVVAVLAVRGAVSATNTERQNNEAYEHGELLLENGEYLEAALQFEALGDYRDAPARANEAYEQQRESRYAQAEELFAQGRYDQAAREFAALGDYHDAPARADAARQERKNANYDAAEALSQAGAHAEASAAFFALGDYGDADARARREQWEAVRAGDIQGLEVHLGTHKGNDLTWAVAAVEDGRALLVSADVLACPVDVELPCTWESCPVRDWLVGDFAIEAFAPDEAAMLVDTGQGAVFLCSADKLVGYMGDAAQRQGIDWRLDREGLLGGMASYVYVNATHYTYDRDLLEKQVGVRPLVWVRV